MMIVVVACSSFQRLHEPVFPERASNALVLSSRIKIFGSPMTPREIDSRCFLTTRKITASFRYGCFKTVRQFFEWIHLPARFLFAWVISGTVAFFCRGADFGQWFREKNRFCAEQRKRFDVSFAHLLLVNRRLQLAHGSFCWIKQAESIELMSISLHQLPRRSQSFLQERLKTDVCQSIFSHPQDNGKKRARMPHCLLILAVEHLWGQVWFGNQNSFNRLRDRCPRSHHHHHTADNDRHHDLHQIIHERSDSPINVGSVFARSLTKKIV